jgi:hypothetical protein
MYPLNKVTDDDYQASYFSYTNGYLYWREAQTGSNKANGDILNYLKIPE